jgi:hypothetical protein
VLDIIKRLPYYTPYNVSIRKSVYKLMKRADGEFFKGANMSLSERNNNSNNIDNAFPVNKNHVMTTCEYTWVIKKGSLFLSR